MGVRGMTPDDARRVRRCPELVRKWRRGTNPADKICDTPAVVPGS